MLDSTRRASKAKAETINNVYLRNIAHILVKIIYIQVEC